MNEEREPNGYIKDSPKSCWSFGLFAQNSAELVWNPAEMVSSRADPNSSHQQSSQVDQDNPG